MGELQKRIAIRSFQFMRYLSEFGEEAIEGENGAKNAEGLAKTICEAVEEMTKEFPLINKELVTKAKQWDNPTREQMKEVIQHSIDLAFERYEWFVKWLMPSAEEAETA